MKQVDIKKIANRAATKAGYSALTTVGYDLANEVVRQRDAQWKRAAKRLNTKHDKCCQGKERVWRYYRDGYQRAFHDLIAAMKEAQP